MKKIIESWTPSIERGIEHSDFALVEYHLSYKNYSIDELRQYKRCAKTICTAAIGESYTWCNLTDTPMLFLGIMQIISAPILFAFLATAPEYKNQLSDLNANLIAAAIMGNVSGGLLSGGYLIKRALCKTGQQEKKATAIAIHELIKDKIEELASDSEDED